MYAEGCIERGLPHQAGLRPTIGLINPNLLGVFQNFVAVYDTFLASPFKLHSNEV